MRGLSFVAALLLSVSVSATVAAPPPENCAAVTTRVPCGQPTDSPLACATKGCCFDASGGNSSCFYAVNGVPITTVHVIQACHFDAGYADTTSNILNEWFHTYFPRALSLGLELDARGGAERLHFLAQSWIVSLFLDCPPSIPGLVCPSPAEIANFTRAVKAGYVYWHAFPFNGEPELMSASMFDAALDLTFALDERFGLPHKKTLSQRDVPGMTRAVIPALSRAGVGAITIGVNPYSTPPMVPRAFVWRDAATGISMPTMVHPNFYGGILFDDAAFFPGLSHAIVFDWRGDNAGPPLSVAEVVADFATIAANFPGATVVASTLDNFTALLTPDILANLPVLETEVGDTWLHGASSDLYKSAANKRAVAARAACIADGGCAPNDPAVANFTRLLLKNAEHTWGKSWTYFTDKKNWSNAAFEEARQSSPTYAKEAIASWEEQRLYGLSAPLEALTGHPLGATIAALWSDLFPAGTPSLAGFTPAAPGAIVTVGTWTLSFDAASGALALLVDGAQSPPTVWANASADGSFLGLSEYRTYDAASLANFSAWYNILPGKASEFGRDPSMSNANPVSYVAPQRLLGLWSQAGATSTTFLVRGDYEPASLHTDYGAPSEVWVQFDVPTSAGGAINVSLSIFNKTATRLADGFFFRFNASGALSWRVDKIGQAVDPFDVQWGGNQRHHGVDANVTAVNDAGAALSIGAPDAPLACFGEPTIFPIPTNVTADRSEGVSFLLADCLWNTNYPFWYPFHEGDENFRWRWTLASTSA
jgi:hypothetical protein